MKTNKTNIFLTKKNIFTCILFVCLFIFSVFLRIPKPLTENWLNSDATYHVLLTLKAYDQTPFRQHKLLPIVSLGGKDDKNIPWGSTIPDKYGNYYYTSFMPLGFIFPYLFIKTFSLPVNEYSLYIFNTIIFFLSWIFCIYLFVNIFKDKINFFTTSIIVTFIYLFSIETMHSHGIVYWSHSLFQLVFILQCIFFLKIDDKKTNYYNFLLLSFISPSIEWTGYISNFGFLIALIIKNKIANKKDKLCSFSKTFTEILTISILSISSFIIFIFHFLTTVNKQDFVDALTKRFFARSLTSQISLWQLFDGYLKSYLPILILTILIVFFILIKDKERKIFCNEMKNNILMLIIIFSPLLENIILKEHATVYSFDRIKAILPIMLLLLICISTFIKNKSEIYIKKFSYTLTFIIILISISNLFLYTKQDNYYRWKENYGNSDTLLVEYIKKQYSQENSVLSQQLSVRGYSNLIFNRGIFEKMDETNTLNNAKKLNKKYAIYLEPENKEWQKYYYNKATIYDIKNNTKTVIYIDGNSLIFNK